MSDKIIQIKNMVCPRCINAVKELLKALKISYTTVKLGEVLLSHELTPKQQKSLKNELNALGFELLESNTSILISKIKTIIIKLIHYSDETLSEKYSVLLTRELHYDYGYLSHLFSAAEGVTIEKYIVRQKIERVKELLFYNELTISEIAYKVGYSSVAHLSSQFKKETGKTPTAFKRENKPTHRALDSLIESKQ